MRAANGTDYAEFQNEILSFYREHGRALPWRQTSDPYAILVSEFMLQQTQTQRVIPKYARWLEEFPTVRALADAPFTQVLGRSGLQPPRALFARVRQKDRARI